MNEITTQEIAQAVKDGDVSFALLWKRFQNRRELMPWNRYDHGRFLDRLIQKARKEGRIEYDKKLRRWRAL